MNVKLIVSTPELQVGESAKICYHTKPIEDGGKDITKSVVGDKGHLAVLRFAFVIFEVSDISVACHTQMLRSKHLDFLVESKRYVDVDKGGFEFIMPEGLDNAQQYLMNQCWERAINSYRALISTGVKKEDARAVLPANTSTNMRVSGNLQGWYDFLKLRLTKHAQAEIRNVAKEVFKILTVEYPQIFTDEVYERLSNG